MMLVFLNDMMMASPLLPIPSLMVNTLFALLTGLPFRGGFIRHSLKLPHISSKLTTRTTRSFSSEGMIN